MKNILFSILLTVILTACHTSFNKKISLNYSDKNLNLEIILDRSNLSKEVYFGTLEVVNLSNKNIRLPASKSNICIIGEKYNKILLNYGFLGNQISSDFIKIVQPGESFKQAIKVKTTEDLDSKNLKISLSKNLYEDPSQGYNLLDDLTFCK